MTFFAHNLFLQVIADEERDKIKEHIQYDFLQDGHFAELRDSEILR